MKIKRSVDIPDRDKINQWVKVKPEKFWKYGLSTKNVVLINTINHVVKSFPEDKFIYKINVNKEQDAINFEDNIGNIRFYIKKFELENTVEYRAEENIYRLYVKIFDSTSIIQRILDDGFGVKPIGRIYYR